MGAAGIGTLSGCSRDRPVELEDGDRLRMRVWSESAATAYEASLEDFTSATGIDVELEVLGWDDYWEQLPMDVASGDLPDVLWMNTANLAQAHASGTLLEVGEIVGEDAAGWESAATDLYRIDEGLWGVPQVWEQSILVAHEGLVAAAEGDAAALVFDSAAPSDPLRELSRALTVDGEGRRPGEPDFDPATRKTFGFSAHPDRTAVLGPFIAAQGGSWQDEKGAMSFASAEGIAAVQYLADLASAHLGPAGQDTVADPSLCRTLFLEGKLGLLQTGTYDLHTLSEEIDGTFTWGIHPVVAGPEGTRPLVHSIAALGIDPGDDDREKAIGELLRWLGGVEGQRPLAENRLGIPAHRDLRGAWEKSWDAAGVDVSVIEVPEEAARPEIGDRSGIATGTAMPIIAEVFLGETDAAEALPRAQQAAREAMG
ncbi:sugar ABC transporter substrate-binding protein [Brachybacterium avium]|uniref:Sugar ABC transporter substrate-binding protein n=1 Tax=Brachybacterium avium TaxID=2017485 RepID=A0A220UHQ2_9MICO|nr:sugar ABC transporter substrate-binding protein [Brachybacterium avium]